MGVILYGNKIYTDVVLVNDVYRYIYDNKKLPRMRDMKIINGYIPFGVYVIRYKTWNNLMELINLNSYRTWLDGSETCDRCNCKKDTQWRYENGVRLCSKCYNGDRNYLYGNIDINTTTGMGIISEYIVHKVLKKSIWLNSKNSFHNKYDIYDVKYGNIDVKAARPRIELKNSKNYKWEFCTKYIEKFNNDSLPNCYFFIAFNLDLSNIEHVWCIKSDSSILKNKGVFSITDLDKCLSKKYKYELDVFEFNKEFKNIHISNIQKLLISSDIVGGITV